MQGGWGEKKSRLSRGVLNAQKKRANLTARRSQKKIVEIKVQIKFDTCKDEENKNLSIKHAMKYCWMEVFDETFFFDRKCQTV